MQMAAAFIQAPTWNEAKQIVEAHRELLQPEADNILQELASYQTRDNALRTIEKRRILLTLCREKGIEVAFMELQSAADQEESFVSELNRIYCEVVVTLRTGNEEEQEALADGLEQRLTNNLPIEGAQDFLQLLVAWLRKQDIQIQVKNLQPAVYDLYTQMLTDVETDQTQQIQN